MGPGGGVDDGVGVPLPVGPDVGLGGAVAGGVGTRVGVSSGAVWEVTVGVEGVAATGQDGQQRGQQDG